MTTPGNPLLYDFDTALQIASAVHRGQKDKQGQPYILHPIRVAGRFTEPRLRVIALLHDVFEDSQPSEHLQLEAEIGVIDDTGGSVLSALRVLTRGDGEDYFAYIERVMVSADPRVVKIIDILDNIDLGRGGAPFERHLRYLLALRQLKYSIPARQDCERNILAVMRQIAIEDKNWKEATDGK